MIQSAQKVFELIEDEENEIIFKEYDKDYFFKNFDETIFKNILSD